MHICALSRISPKQWILLWSLVLIFFLGAFFFFRGHPAVYYLIIYDSQNDLILEETKVNLGDYITLEYIHSVDGTPVNSKFRIENEGLRLVEEKYLWYGSGLEAGGGYKFSFDNNEVSVSGYDRLFEQLPLRVARTVPQELHLHNQNKTILLSDLAPGGSLLQIEILER